LTGITMKTLTKAIIGSVVGLTLLVGSAIAENIPLTLYGSTMTAPVQINGAITLNFVLDTGASTVILTDDVIRTLRRAGALQSSDFIAHKTYTLADGSHYTGAQVVLRTLTLGTRVFTNVIAGVVPAGGNLLLGQNILGNLGTWSIDNDRHRLIIGKAAKATNAQQATSLPYTSPIALCPWSTTLGREHCLSGFATGNTLSYAGYVIERTFVPDTKQTEELPVWGQSSGAIKKDKKVLVQFGTGGNGKDSTQIGLVSLLGGEEKQLIVIQYSGGAHCCYSTQIYRLVPQLRLIFTSEDYHSSFTPALIDFQGDGAYELLMRVSSFAYF
jgi:hypothetical protein